MKQLTKKQAIAIYRSGEWMDWTDEDIVKIQLFQDRVLMPFDRYHQAIENVLGRPVWTHEFAFRDRLIDEYQKERPTPTFEDIMALLPQEKIIVLNV